MADKIAKFEDYKKRDNTEEINIQIEDPCDFLNEAEREEYFKERQKKAEEAPSASDKEDEKPAPEPKMGHSKEYDSKAEDKYRDSADDDDEEDYDDDYDDEYGDEEEESSDQEAKGGFPIEFFIRVSSIITGALILALLAIFAKVKIYDRYFAKDPDEVQAVVAALPAGYIEKNDIVTVTAKSLNLRTVDNSDSSSTVVTSVSEGTTLNRIAVNADGTWALVDYNGAQVYASMKYLKEN